MMIENNKIKKRKETQMNWITIRISPELETNIINNSMVGHTVTEISFTFSIANFHSASINAVRLLNYCE